MVLLLKKLLMIGDGERLNFGSPNISNEEF